MGAPGGCRLDGLMNVFGERGPMGECLKISPRTWVRFGSTMGTKGTKLCISVIGELAPLLSVLGTKCIYAPQNRGHPDLDACGCVRVSPNPDVCGCIICVTAISHHPL